MPKPKGREPLSAAPPYLDDRKEEEGDEPPRRSRLSSFLWDVLQKTRRRQEVDGHSVTFSSVPHSGEWYRDKVVVLPEKEVENVNTVVEDNTWKPDVCIHGKGSSGRVDPVLPSVTFCAPSPPFASSPPGTRESFSSDRGVGVPLGTSPTIPTTTASGVLRTTKAHSSAHHQYYCSYYSHRPLHKDAAPLPASPSGSYFLPAQLLSHESTGSVHEVFPMRQGTPLKHYKDDVDHVEDETERKKREEEVTLLQVKREGKEVPEKAEKEGVRKISADLQSTATISTSPISCGKRSDRVMHVPPTLQSNPEPPPLPMLTTTTRTVPTSYRHPNTLPLVVLFVDLLGYAVYLFYYIAYLRYSFSHISYGKWSGCIVFLSVSVLWHALFLLCFYRLRFEDPGWVPEIPWAYRPRTGEMGWSGGEPTAASDTHNTPKIKHTACLQEDKPKEEKESTTWKISPGGEPRTSSSSHRAGTGTGTGGDVEPVESSHPSSSFPVNCTIHDGPRPSVLQRLPLQVTEGSRRKKKVEKPIVETGLTTTTTTPPASPMSPLHSSASIRSSEVRQGLAPHFSYLHSVPLVNPYVVFWRQVERTYWEEQGRAALYSATSFPLPRSPSSSSSSSSLPPPSSSLLPCVEEANMVVVGEPSSRLVSFFSRRSSSGAGWTSSSPIRNPGWRSPPRQSSNAVPPHNQHTEEVPFRRNRNENNFPSSPASPMVVPSSLVLAVAVDRVGPTMAPERVPCSATSPPFSSTTEEDEQARASGVSWRTPLGTRLLPCLSDPIPPSSRISSPLFPFSSASSRISKHVDPTKECCTFQQGAREETPEEAPPHPSLPNRRSKKNRTKKINFMVHTTSHSSSTRSSTEGAVPKRPPALDPFSSSSLACPPSVFSKRARSRWGAMGVNTVTTRLRYCHDCQQYMPDRSFHCPSCNQCVFLFDHHCDFINSCIGQKNYKIFFGFLFHSFLHALLVFIGTILGMLYFRIYNLEEEKDGVGRSTAQDSLKEVETSYGSGSNHTSMKPTFTTTTTTRSAWKGGILSRNIWLCIFSPMACAALVISLFCFILLVKCAIWGFMYGLTTEEYIRWVNEVKDFEWQHWMEREKRKKKRSKRKRNSSSKKEASYTISHLHSPPRQKNDMASVQASTSGAAAGFSFSSILAETSAPVEREGEDGVSIAHPLDAPLLYTAHHADSSPRDPNAYHEASADVENKKREGFKPKSLFSLSSFTRRLPLLPSPLSPPPSSPHETSSSPPYFFFSFFYLTCSCMVSLPSFLWPPRYPIYLYKDETARDREERVKAFHRAVLGEDWKWWEVFWPRPPRGISFAPVYNDET